MLLNEKDPPKELAEQKILVFDYPGMAGKFLRARYYICLEDSGTFICDVHYDGESEPQEGRWKGTDWGMFFHSLPLPITVSPLWRVWAPKQSTP